MELNSENIKVTIEDFKEFEKTLVSRLRNLKIFDSEGFKITYGFSPKPSYGSFEEVVANTKQGSNYPSAIRLIFLPQKDSFYYFLTKEGGFIKTGTKKVSVKTIDDIKEKTDDEIIDFILNS